MSEIVTLQATTTNAPATHDVSTGEGFAIATVVIFVFVALGLAVERFVAQHDSSSDDERHDRERDQ